MVSEMIRSLQDQGGAALQAECSPSSWPFWAALAGVYCCWKAVKFLRADADMRLLSKRRVPANAFEDKVVWVTGASQGIGRELARYFAAKGAHVILSARRKHALEATKALLSGKHAFTAMVLPFDLTAPYEELHQVAQAADGAFGSAGVDFMIHNAGASQSAAVEDVSSAVVNSMFEINTLAPIRFTRALLPFMLSREKGRLVIVASMAGVVPSPGQSLYSGAKSGLIAYFAALFAELNTRGIGVTICCPGPVSTGSDEAPRVVYGPEGLISQHHPVKGGSRMSPERVVELIGQAAYHGIDMCWICKHPILLLGYLVQYFPSVGAAVMRFIGPGRVSQMKGGKGGYNFREVILGRVSRKKIIQNEKLE